MLKNERGQVVFNDLSGSRFGTVVVLPEHERQSNGGTKWKYQCDCGVVAWAWAEVLKRQPDFCCKECRKHVQRKARTIHGGKYTALYRVWSSMINRCANPMNNSFHRYGGRGIKVCEQWKGENGFVAFREAMGDPPFTGATIDRKDNDADYSPENCQWSTRIEQANNRSTNQMLTFAGETLTWSQWSRRTGIEKSVIRQRARKGWPPDKILSTEKF